MPTTWLCIAFCVLNLIAYLQLWDWRSLAVALACGFVAVARVIA